MEIGREKYFRCFKSRLLYQLIKRQLISIHKCNSALLTSLPGSRMIPASFILSGYMNSSTESNN